MFVTVTILSPNFLLNNCCIKIMVDTVKLWKTFTRRRRYFYTISATERLRFPIQIFNTLLFCSTYVTLRHHVDAKTSSAIPYMANRAKVYYGESNDRIATQRYSSPEIPIGSRVMSRTTITPSGRRSRKMVANVAGCRSFCTFRDCHTSIAFTPVGPQPNLAHIFGWIWD